MSISGYPWCLFVPRFDFVLLSASTNPLHVWDPKRRLFLQLIPLRKALVKMNEPPPAWGPAEKAPLPPWKRLHILSVSHHQSCIFGAACSITEHQTPATICNRQHSFHAHSRQIRVHCPKRCATESDITGTGSLSVRSTRDWRKSKNEEKRGFLEFRKQQRRRKKMAKPNYSGTYHMVEQENMDSYLGALGTNLYTVF